MTLTRDLDYPYNDDGFSYEEFTLAGADSPGSRRVDRERFVALLQMNREIAELRGSQVKVTASWGCDRCGQQCTAVGWDPGPAARFPGQPPLALTADLHVCAPAGWRARARALWRGTGTAPQLVLPELPRRLVAVMRERSPAGPA